MKLYVPNPQVWVDFFDRVSRDKASLHQSGRGRSPRVIAVTPTSEEQRVSIKAVLPTEQTAAQAKSALEREDINPKSVEKAFQNLSEPPRGKRKRKSSELSSVKEKRRRVTKPGETKRKTKKREGNKGSRLLYTKGRRDIFEIK